MPPVAAAFAAVGAGAAGIAQIATVVSAVGTGLSVVGAVTGNKNLMKIGGTMALAGGITSLATGALGSGTAAAGEGLAEGAAATSAGEGLGAAGGALGQAADFGAGSAGYAGQAATIGLPDIAEKSTGLINQGSNAYQKFANGTQTPGGTTPEQAISESSPTNISSAAYGAIKPPTDTSSNGITAWFKSLDPRTQSTILQSGAGAVGGLFQGWTEDQKRAFERDRFNLASSNASAQPILNFSKPAGLINTVKA